eukprot:Transcript_17981.p1 GENE.Transcript_17981~~Transcript_17981.p1  ORF type:complete len:242 (+),score=32.48 Transcript_17981:125-850(+)
MADDDSDDDLMAGFADDEPQPPAGTLVATAPPRLAAAPSAQQLSVVATALAPRGEPIELAGNNTTPVWSLYKSVMSTVFSGVKQLVEGEGLEPTVATDIRDKWVDRINTSGVLNHGFVPRQEPGPMSTAVGGGQRFVAPQHLVPATTAMATAVATTSHSGGPSSLGTVRGDEMYMNAPVNANAGRPPQTMVRRRTALHASHCARMPALPLFQGVHRAASRGPEGNCRHAGCAQEPPAKRRK